VAHKPGDVDEVAVAVVVTRDIVRNSEKGVHEHPTVEDVDFGVIQTYLIALSLGRSVRNLVPSPATLASRHTGTAASAARWPMDRGGPPRRPSQPTFALYVANAVKVRSEVGSKWRATMAHPS
jgi:hypothetical protein